MKCVFLAELSLGYTRRVGCLTYCAQTKEFNEFTLAASRRLIENGEIVGVKWNDTPDGGEYIPDKDYGLDNILVKSGVGKFRPLLNDIPGAPVNSMYFVVRVLDTDYRGRLYEIVNQRCQRTKITEEQLRGLADITQVAGVRITEDEITLLDSVLYEDRRKHEDAGAAYDKAVISEDEKRVSSVKGSGSAKKASPAKSTKKATTVAAKKRSTTIKKK